MQLDEFISRFAALSDEVFGQTFPHPFLLEAGRPMGQDALPDAETGTSGRQVFLLRADRVELVIGRKPVDIQIVLNSVSSRHALLAPPQAGRPHWTLSDDASTNGTFVDGVKLAPRQPVALQDGAALRFGPGAEARFTFLESASFLRAFRRLAKASGAPHPGRAAALRDPLAETDPGLRTFPAAEDGGATVVTGPSQPSAGEARNLLLVCEPFDPLPLREGEEVVLGRSPGSATMVLPDKNVSRRHAGIVRRGNAVFIRDLGSANGTFIGKTQVGTQPMELGIGKHVSVGPYTVMVSGPIDALAHTSIVPVKEDWKAPLEGDLAQRPALDLFNDVEIGQVTGILRVESGKLRGLITFRAGEPVDAQTNEGDEGDAAVRAVMSLTSGRFWLDPEAKVHVAERSTRRVTRSFSELALEDFLGQA
ncbi:MAG: FHA domain-containing protein [Planctomycetota bacterium]